MTRQWFLRGHRILWTQPRTTWQAWRYWRRYGRISKKDREAMRTGPQPVDDHEKWAH